MTALDHITLAAQKILASTGASTHAPFLILRIGISFLICSVKPPILEERLMRRESTQYRDGKQTEGDNDSDDGNTDGKGKAPV